MRPTILTAFLGYMLVCVALMYDLGPALPHLASAGHAESALRDVRGGILRDALHDRAVPGILADRAGALRLAQAAEDRHSGISIPLVILGVILSTLHQSSLGTVYLIMPEKLHPFWYSPLLPVFFFISAIAVGLAMTIFESSLSSKYFGQQLELPNPAGTGPRAGGRAVACTAFFASKTCLHRGSA